MPPIHEEPDAPSARPRGLSLPWLIAAGTTVIVLVGVGLAVRAAHRQNNTALAQAPKRVGTLAVKEAVYRLQHRYVGTLMAWEESKLGPQFISGYVTEVRVRPGAVVRRGEALAIIEPERAKAQNTVSLMQAQAIQASLSALANQSERIQGLRKKGIVSENEAENKLAEVLSEKARLEAAKAQMASTDVEFQDTVQRAPFDGEIAERYLDPGAFVRPGSFILSVVNRTRIRCAADAPEGDHPFLTVGRSVHLDLLADGKQMEAKISRVSPAADPSTRTIHFELDLDNKDHSLPVGTTAEMLILETEGRKVIELPSAAARVEGTRAIVFVVEGDRVRKKVLQFLGEREGQLYLSPDVPEGTMVVLDGRAQLEDGDLVLASPAQSVTAESGVRP
jgi:RND family efflux transporter MFP subunit